MRISMFTFALSCFALTAMTGCSTLDNMRDAWAWDATQPQPRQVLDASETADLNARIAQLRQERNDLRARVSAEPSPQGRQNLYVELHDLGLRLSPLERRLAASFATR